MKTLNTNYALTFQLSRVAQGRLVEELPELLGFEVGPGVDEDDRRHRLRLEHRQVRNFSGKCGRKVAAKFSGVGAFANAELPVQRRTVV